MLQLDAFAVVFTWWALDAFALAQTRRGSLRQGMLLQMVQRGVLLKFVIPGRPCLSDPDLERGSGGWLRCKVAGNWKQCPRSFWKTRILPKGGLYVRSLGFAVFSSMASTLSWARHIVAPFMYGAFDSIHQSATSAFLGPLFGSTPSSHSSWNSLRCGAFRANDTGQT